MKNRGQYILEIGDNIFRYHNGHFSQIEDISDQEEPVWLITNFPSETQKTISRVSTVETELKYSGLMAGKKLQEEGEFTEPVHIITHTGKKKGENRSELFYTAVAAKRFHHYQDRINESPATFLIFPLYRVLLLIIRKMQTKQPVALIFRHGRHADLLIACHKKVYYANRSTSFDLSNDQVNALWGMIHNDLTTVEREHKINLSQCVICNWFDAQDQPDWPERTISQTPSRLVTIDGESKDCSLLPLLDLLSASDSISPAIEKLTHTAKQIIPIAQLILVIFTTGLFAGTTILQTKTAAVRQEITMVKQEIVTLGQFSLAAKVDYQETLKLLTTLNNYRVSKTFKSLINDLSSAVSPHMVIEQVIAGVENNEMKIELRGSINAGFQTAYQGYQNLIRNLKHNKYTIQDSTFNTEIDQAEFILTYTSQMGEK